MNTSAKTGAKVGRARAAECLVWVGILVVALAGCGGEDSSPGRKPGTPGASGSGSSVGNTAGSTANGAGSDGFGNATAGSAGSPVHVPTMPVAGTAGGTCIKGMADTSPVTPVVWLIVDGSSSMNMPFDATASRWVTLRETLMAPGGIVDSLQVVVKFGLVIYAGGEDQSQCVRMVTVQPALNNFANLDAMYPRTPLGSGTPTDKALENVVMNLPVLNEQQLDQRNDPIFVVLATDGAPNNLCGNMGGGGGGGSAGDPAVMQKVIDVVTSGTMKGMQMFVISLAGADMGLQAHLEQVAAATRSKLPPFVPATKMDLINNFQSIVGGASCQLTLNGMVAAGKECTGKVLLNGMELTCNSDNGWRMPDDHTVQLTGTACDMLLSTQSLVTADFPCGVFIVK